jgi:N-acetylneuraminic acid mutarotase
MEDSIMKKHIKFHAWDLTIVSMILILLGIAVIFFPSISLAQEPWTEKKDMPTARAGFSTSVVDGKIYAIGGATILSEVSPSLATVDMYDPATNTWTPKASMSTARFMHYSAVVNGIIYVFGSHNDGTVEAYDPATDSWTKKSNMSSVRGAHRAVAVNGKIYVIGGSMPPNYPALKIVEEYDPATDTWTRKADMPIGKWSVATSVVDGIIYVIGGQSAGHSWSSTVYAYNPATDTWTQKTNMPTGRTHFSACALNGIIFAIGGGTTPSDVLSTVEAYDPVTDTWEKNKANMPTPRSDFGISVVNGKIYIIGGAKAWQTPGFSTVEEYDPSKDLTELVNNVTLNKCYAVPGSDNVCIFTKMNNPAGVTLFAKIETSDQTRVDSLQLFDDGNHNDGNAGDSLYANIWPVSSEEEQLYEVDLQVTRVDNDTVIHRMNQLAAFTTIGPVVFDSFSFRGSDAELNPGDFIRIYVTLKNNGKTAAATDIEAQLVSLDTSWVRVRTATQTYPDIPPGETGRNFISCRLDILDAYPGNTPIPMEIRISSHDIVFWSDTFSITADPTEVQSRGESGPSWFALSNIYPNPFNPETTIEYAVKEPCEVRLIVTNVLGQTVKEPIHSFHQPGEYTVHVHMQDNPSGLYFYHIVMGDFQAVKKMVKIE